MREIKFRGKRLDNGEWVDGDLLHIDGSCLIYFGSKDQTSELEIDRNYVIAVEIFRDEIAVVDPSTVGQYTGLKDKNGREIYEEDIIKTDFSYATWIGFVHFNKGNFELVDSDKNGQYLTLSVLSDIKIIGNIHDNPDLLKTE